MNKQEDRQLRIWLAVLYPDDNESHALALDLLSKILEYDYATIHHIPIIKEDGEMLKKGHNHLVVWFDKPMRKSTFIKRLELDKEADWHCFRGLDELKGKDGKRMFHSVDNYLDYCTHLNNPDKIDKYIFEDFETNVPDRVASALNNNYKSKPEYFLELVDFIDATYQMNRNCVFWGLNQWFTYAYKKGFGEVAYSNWSKFKDIVNEYKIQ